VRKTVGQTSLAFKLFIAATLVSSAYAAEFQSGQAARAVIGQSSFSSHESGITAHALAIVKGQLYAADAGNHLQTFDLSKLPGVKDEPTDQPGAACSVCGLAPLAVADQPVFQGVAAAASFGKTVVVADTANHRVLIWLGITPSPKPDVVLSRPFLDPVSVALDGRHLFVGDAGWRRILIWNTLPSSDDTPADEVLGQPDFSSSTISDTPGSASLHTPAALVSDGVNLFVADSSDRRILVFTPGDSALTADALVNSASLLSTGFAPGTLLTLQGAALSDVSESAQNTEDTPLPHQLGGVQVLLNGMPLPLLSVSPEHVQLQMPSDLGSASAGSLYVRTAHAAGTISTTNAIAVKFTAASPGIFAIGTQEPRNGLLLHAAGAPVSADTPAKPGEVVTVWATGLGQVDSEDRQTLRPVNVSVNDEPAEVVSATLPQGAVGVYEVRVILPSALRPGGSAQLLLSQSGVTSNTVSFPLE
jgi:uncharacterized protein (TIGR03437 family)